MESWVRIEGGLEYRYVLNCFAGYGCVMCRGCGYRGRKVRLYARVEKHHLFAYLYFDSAQTNSAMILCNN